MRFKQYLTEMSFEEKDIPRTFRVVFEVDAYDKSRFMKNIRQLSNMKLEGLTGISDKHDIGFHWLGVARDAMLIMNGKEVVKLNKISRILYGNPNYFLSNKMAMAKRVFNKSSGTSGDSNILHNIMEYLFLVMGREKKVDKYHVQYTAAQQDYAHVAYKKQTNINSSKDLVRWIRKAGEVLRKEQEEKTSFKDHHIIAVIDDIEKLSDKSIEDSIKGAFEEIGKTYGDEGEWVIKNDYLKVPKGSYLYILAPKKAYKEAVKLKKTKPDIYKGREWMGDFKFMEKFDTLQEEFEKQGIFKKYIVKFIDNSEWKRVQSWHLSQRDKK